MNFRKTILATVAALTITASTALSGAAQVTDTSSVTIGGGAFSVSLDATNFANLPYSLVDQTVSGGSIDLTVQDLTGNAAGWEVTLSLTDFIGQSRPSQTPIESENLDITSYNISVATVGSQPVNTAEMPVDYGETAPQLNWKANPGFGQGSYILHMNADLVVPGRTEAQTYTSTGTVAIVAGP